MRRAVYPFLLLFLGGLPVLAHYGPPFPLQVDQKVGPYVASVWSDPDIGTATFYVVLDAPKGHKPPARTSVRIGVQPLNHRLPEVFYDAEPQPVDEGARYMAKIQFDKGEMWHVRTVLSGSAGGGEMSTQVEATPDGILGPFGSLVYAFPFLSVGFLWIKAVLRRRAAPAPAIQVGKEVEGA
ncbi:MAG TPA: hypothetical protein VGP73_01485 [Thermoanaerobaculia bacterium]